MYLDHDFTQAEALGSDPARRDPAGPSMLTGLEQAAVAIGCAEAHDLGWDGFKLRSSLWRATIGRMLPALGVRPARPLADKRLELLRLYACMHRRGHPDVHEVAARLSAGGLTRFALIEVEDRVNGAGEHGR